MIIYRIEHAIYGMGPYSPGGLPSRLSAVLKRVWDCKRSSFYKSAGYYSHPYPSTVKRGYYFGFEDIESLKAWFNHANMLQELKKLNFVCRIYSVDIQYTETHDFSGQISFNKTYAKCLDEMMLDKLDI